MSVLSIGELQVSAATGGRAIGDAEQLVVLVHGAAMDRTVWSLQTRWLSHHGCPALAIDLPGHGASPEPERGSIADYAEWVASLVQELDRPVHFVGHSMGSFIGIEAALQTNLASLTLVGTAAAMPVHPALLEAAQANDPLAAQLMSGWAFAPATRTGPHPSPGGSMVGATLAMIGQAAPGVLHNDLSICAAYATALESAAATTVPTTLILGMLDRMTPIVKAQPLIDSFPSCVVEAIDGVGPHDSNRGPDRDEARAEVGRRSRERR